MSLGSKEQNNTRRQFLMHFYENRLQSYQNWPFDSDCKCVPEKVSDNCRFLYLYFYQTSTLWFSLQLLVFTTILLLKALIQSGVLYVKKNLKAGSQMTIPGMFIVPLTPYSLISTVFVLLTALLCYKNCSFYFLGKNINRMHQSANT